jgi:hypothetical protein
MELLLGKLSHLRNNNYNVLSIDNFHEEVILTAWFTLQYCGNIFNGLFNTNNPTFSNKIFAWLTEVCDLTVVIRMTTIDCILIILLLCKISFI